MIVVSPDETRGIRRRAFTLENVETLENQPGVYQLYDDRGKLLYSGSSKEIRRRLTDTIYNRGDYRMVDGKGAMLCNVSSFDVTYGPVSQNRLNEKRYKSQAEFNKR